MAAEEHQISRAGPRVVVTVPDEIDAMNADETRERCCPRPVPA